MFVENQYSLHHSGNRSTERSMAVPFCLMSRAITSATYTTVRHGGPMTIPHADANQNIPANIEEINIAACNMNSINAINCHSPSVAAHSLRRQRDNVPLIAAGYRRRGGYRVGKT
jgi:hypothetical protein